MILNLDFVPFLRPQFCYDLEAERASKTFVMNRFLVSTLDWVDLPWARDQQANTACQNRISKASAWHGRTQAWDAKLETLAFWKFLSDLTFYETKAIAGFNEEDLFHRKTLIKPG